jgi:fumarylacetoacetase
VYGPSRAMDLELEMGAIVGKPVAKGQRLHFKDADEHVFGFVLVNDWNSEKYFSKTCLYC